MRVGLVAARLGGTDGVSLETAKWRAVLERMGHQTFLCAGELEPGERDATLVPAMSFADAEAAAVTRAAFDAGSDRSAVRREIDRLTAALLPALRSFVAAVGPDLIVVENALAIPMHLPLGVALARLIEESGLATVAHHHDLWWERERFAGCVVPEVLESAFPPDLPSLRHVTINSLAARNLHERRGLDSTVVPNVFDFDTPRPAVDDYGAGFRAAVGVAQEELLVLQPTRVVPRKGIELAVELVARLADPTARLVITHPAGDEGGEYLERLYALAAAAGVDLRYVADRVSDRRATVGDRRTYTLWDAYQHADLVTYPSLYEGFGNALLETVYFGRPLVVNRYPVYEADIRPLGFRFVELAGAVTDEAVSEVRALLADPERRAADAEHNVDVARRHFSYAVLERRLADLLSVAAA